MLGWHIKIDSVFIDKLKAKKRERITYEKPDSSTPRGA